VHGQELTMPEGNGPGPGVMDRRKPRTRPSLWPVAVAVLVGMILGAIVLYLVATQFRTSPPGLNPAAAERTPEPKSDPDDEEQEAIRVFRDAKDSVVNVDTVVLVRNRLDMRIQEAQTGTGSGFFWDDEGRIVTNSHVIREAVAHRYRLRIVLADRTAWTAAVIGVAPEYDLAVLQITDSNFPKSQVRKIRVGTSHDLEVGQKVFAIGNPFGLSLSMTKGIVSALDREIESLTDRPITGAIQIDAPINPGNSGGPLLDKDGRLIGVNTSIATPSGGNVGIGFAIPVDTVNTVVTELIRSGRILKPDAGIRLVELRRLRRAGFPSGVMIQTVEPGGPAAKAGLRGIRVDPESGDVYPGDLILAVDGKEVENNTDFARIISQYKVGSMVKLTIERDENRREVELTLRGV
jgi:S1-C subfamily serine protease